MAWEARTEPAVVEIFEKLWGEKELLSSFDGMNISLPNRKDLNWSPWPHCDQNPERKGRVHPEPAAEQDILTLHQDASRSGSSQLCTEWSQRRRFDADARIRRTFRRVLFPATSSRRP